MSQPHIRPIDRDNQAWSSLISQKYQFALPSWLIDWFDGGWWEHRTAGEFSDPIDPQALLDPSPEYIWPALMPCSFLPLVGNNAGDFLCLNIRPPTKDTFEIVHWYHGGGDWIPWGKNLPQAIVFGGLVDRLPGPRHRHAEPAEPRPVHSDADRLVLWALEHLPDAIAKSFDAEGLPNPSVPSAVAAAQLIQHGVADVATRLELIEEALFPKDGVCDWILAESLAVAVLDRRQDLAWAWNVAALAASKRGDSDLAIDRWANACLCSNFSDQSVRLRHHWDQSQAAKFCVSQLQSLDRARVESRLDDRQRTLLDLYSLSDQAERVRSVTDYWLAQGQQFECQGRLDEACRCVIAAGWDLGAAPMDAFEQILSEATRLASIDGQCGQSALASVHLNCFRDRYGKS